jgi:NTP pyrophosphatase (non-canonical NTP hydrolase)
MSAENFNELTAAEAERLALLLEEMGEAQQAIGKILRHGYHSENPDTQDHVDNRMMLEKELGDVSHAIDRMIRASDINREVIANFRRKKAKKVEKYLHHQDGGEW